MDARPNVLNKILPCTKRCLFEFRSSNGANSSIYEVYGYGLDDSADEYIQSFTEIPLDFKAGSDLTIITKCCGLVDNPVGADKKIRIVPMYNFVRNGVVIGASVSLDAVLITIPDGQEKWSTQEVIAGTIPNLQAGDFISTKLTRDADHVDDNYVGDFAIIRPIVGQYIADKIGLT